MSGSSFAQKIAISGAMPRLSAGMGQTVNIGFLAPLSGPVQSWGLPGLQGCRIWEDWLNMSGGLLLGGRRHPVKIHSYDCKYEPARARQGARALIRDHNIQLLMTLGGESLSIVKHELMDQKLLTSTLLPSDLSPDTPYLLAPSELHPIYNVTGVDWVHRQRPDLQTVALCAQTDSLGLPSLATYRAAFNAAGIAQVKEIQYDPDAHNIDEIVTTMIATDPDILCWCTSYTPAVHAMTECAYAKGYKGQILSCTLDHYDKLVARTSETFLEGTLFQFPDFDDPKLQKKDFFFNQPKTFFQEYTERYPDSWTAVSWEFVATLDIWHAAVEKAGTPNSTSVLAAMKQMGHVTHAFGPANWWGADVFGIDNALVSDWPVVQIQNGKARILEFGSIPNWLAKHSDLLRKEMSDLGQLWEQRLVSELAPAHLQGRGLE